MKHLKVALTFGLVIGVLVIAFFVSVYFAEKAKQREQQKPQGNLLQNNEGFGYKFQIKNELINDLQSEQHDYATMYSIPHEGTVSGYTALFRIIATPKELAKKFATLCAQNRNTSPEQCLDFENSDGQNNLFYFHIIGSQDSDLLTAIDPKTIQRNSDKIEVLMSEVKNTISYYDVPSLPKFLIKASNNLGYQYSYPSEYSSLGQESFTLTLPISLDKADMISGSFGGFQNILPIKYCGPSGICQNTTQNFGIDVLNINLTEEELKNSALGPNLTKVQIAGYTVYQYNEGAEGEGINYSFVISPINEGQILVVAHKYIDETVVRNYLSAKGFVTYDRQKKIVTDLIDSILFKTP